MPWLQMTFILKSSVQRQRNRRELASVLIDEIAYRLRETCGRNQSSKRATAEFISGVNLSCFVGQSGGTGQSGGVSLIV